MTEFQGRCLEKVKQLLHDKGLADKLVFQEIQGRHEQYLLAEQTLGKTKYQIYIYADEAGLMVLDKWSICERPAFTDELVLIQAFCQLLAEKLP